MKIVCVFGEESLGSYKRFSHIVDTTKKRNWEHLDVLPTHSLSEVLASGSLFSNERLITAHDAQKISIKDYEWLSKHNSEYEGRLLLYFPNTIPAAVKKLLPKDTVYEEFKQKKELFMFLESIEPNRGQLLIKQFHRIIETDAPELVLAMLGRHVRDLAWVKSGSIGLAAPPWRLQKLTRQAQKFSSDKLKQFIHDLSDADIKSKSGGGDITLLLDIIFIKL